MVTQFVMGASIIIQLSAALLSLKLIKITGRKRAWIFISIAIILMTFRRAIPFFQMMVRDTWPSAFQTAEVVALVTSILMLMGVAMIGPVFSSIRESEEHFRIKDRQLNGILSASPIGICFIENGRPTFANKAILSMFRHETIESFAEGDMVELYASREEYERVIRSIRSSQKKRSYAMIDAEFRRKDGTIFQGHLRINQSDPVRPWKRAVATISDITRRKQAERALAEEKTRLAVTLRSIGDGVICTDMDSRISMMNRVAEDLTAWTEAEAMDKPLDQVFRIVNELTQKPCENPVEKVLSSGGTVGLSNHTVLIDKNGKKRTLADSASPIMNENGRIIGVVLVFRDVTETQKMEQELQKLNKLESVGLLAGGIAHDFNNILMSILGNISLAKLSSDPGSRILELMDEAEKASFRAKDLTQQLLTFAKGGKPIKKTIDLSKLITDSAGLAVKGSNVLTEFHIAHDLHSVDVDEGQISQVINNLIINADHAMPDGGIIQTTVENIILNRETVPTLDSGDYVTISIRDQGIGIPDKHISKIFDPYFTTKQKGSGLGLAISHSIITNHGGMITVESSLQNGTCFHVYLPASINRLVAESIQEIKPVSGRGRILVMDDEEIVREIIGEMLQTIGYECEFAPDGAEALTLYQNAKASGRPFDAVIMDLTIPGGMGGKTAINRLLKIDPNARAIVSSGYSNDPVMAEYAKYGFRDIIAKPYRLTELSDVLSRVVC